jgi:membrane protein DedA with SNARE-associated domain
VVLVRRMTAAAAAAAVTVACLFTEWLCYVLGRLHSSYVLSTKFGLHRIDFINKTLLNDDFSIFILNFLFIYVKTHKF